MMNNWNFQIISMTVDPTIKFPLSVRNEPIPRTEDVKNEPHRDINERKIQIMMKTKEVKAWSDSSDLLSNRK